MKARIIIKTYEREDVARIMTFADYLGVSPERMTEEQQGLIGEWVTEFTDDTAGWFTRHVLRLQSKFTVRGHGGVMEPIRVLIEIQ